MKIAVITAALPERYPLLAESMASVRAQTLPADVELEHYVCVNERGDVQGPVNDLVRGALGWADWLLPLADDDLLEPNYLLETTKRVTELTQVVYAWCRVEGRNWSPNRSFDADELRKANYIPSTALIRGAAWQKLGGYHDERLEDYGLWLRILNHYGDDAFYCVERPLWIYRASHELGNRNLDLSL